MNIIIVIERSLTTSSCCTHLDVNNDDKTKDKLIFINFIENFYKCKMHDGFHHLTKHHQNDIKLMIFKSH